jgi:putative transposase
VPGFVKCGRFRATGGGERRYTNFIHARGRWTGHLFQSRLASVLLNDDHFVRAVRYVSLNPVRARLVVAAERWPWSSVQAHLARTDNAVVTVRPVLDRIPHLDFLLRDQDEDDYAGLRRAESTGRPLATSEQVEVLERILGRKIARQAPGRKQLDKINENEQTRLL